MAPCVPVFSRGPLEDRCVECRGLPASIHVVDHVRTDRERPEVLSMVDSVGGAVHVLSPVSSRARLRPSQSLTTRVMDSAGGNDSSGTVPVNRQPRLGAPFHSHLTSSTATTTGGEDPCPMEGDESQPQEGWMVRHHQHRLCLGGVQGRLDNNPCLMALVPHREQLQGQRYGHVHPYSTRVLRLFHVFLCLQQVRLRLGNSTGVRHCQMAMNPARGKPAPPAV